MAAKKPKIEYYWAGGKPILSLSGKNTGLQGPVVNVRIVAANGEVVGQITQGFRDKTDARRGVDALRDVLNGGGLVTVTNVGGNQTREVGPGRKPS